MSSGPCGGGYGDAALRSKQAITADVADGLIGEAAARELFGAR